MVKPVLNLVKNETDKTARINLYGIVGWSWEKEPAEQITAQNFIKLLASLEKDYQTINVHIHSPGGDVHEGLAICNAILASKRTVNTYNDGIAMSMGATILACGKSRFAAKGSITMIHNASTFTWGNANAMREKADALQVYDDVLAEFFADAMGKPVEEVKSTYFDHTDHFLTAKQAEATGLVTIANYEADTTQMPENATALGFEGVAAFYMARTPQPTNSQINNQDMFGNNKFKTLASLAKLAVTDVTADMVEAINNEIETEKIPGVTLVLDSTLQSVQDEADKVPTLAASVTDLEGKLTAEQTKVTDLEKQVSDLKAKLRLPAADATPPKPAGTDATPADDNDDTENYDTSVDAEFRQLYGN